MALEEHLKTLRKKHETLSKRVEQVQRNPSVDQLEIQEMKKQKLKLKERISRLS